MSTTYGNRRDYRKIDLYVRRIGETTWRYAVSTTWVRTCREAVAHYQPTGAGVTFQIKAHFASPKSAR